MASPNSNRRSLLISFTRDFRRRIKNLSRSTVCCSGVRSATIIFCSCLPLPFPRKFNSSGFFFCRENKLNIARRPKGQVYVAHSISLQTVGMLPKMSHCVAGLCGEIDGIIFGHYLIVRNENPLFSWSNLLKSTHKGDGSLAGHLPSIQLPNRMQNTCFACYFSEQKLSDISSWWEAA